MKNKSLLLCSCVLMCSCLQQNKPNETIAPGKNNGKALLESCQIRPIDSLAEIKTMLFKELNRHSEDTTFGFFSMFTNKEEEISKGEIHIGELFHSSQKVAVLGWSVSDTTIDVEIFEAEKGNWTPLYSLKSLPSIKSGISLQDSFLFFRDYNADGWKDLEVTIEAWDGIGVGHRSKLWLLSKNGMTSVLGFESIDSPEFDPKTGIINSYLSGGCADMAMHFSEWRLKLATVYCLRNIEVDCCVGEDPNCLVSVNGKRPKPVPPNQVYRYVPPFFQAEVFEKMQE